MPRLLEQRWAAMACCDVVLERRNEMVDSSRGTNPDAEVPECYRLIDATPHSANAWACDTRNSATKRDLDDDLLLLASKLGIPTESGNVGEVARRVMSWLKWEKGYQKRDAERMPVRTAIQLMAVALEDDDAKQAMPAKPISKKAERVEWLARALLLVQEHPEWPDAEVARQVEKHPSTLSRNKTYQQAAAMARSSKKDRHRGFIVMDEDSGQRRGVVAYSDDPAERDLDE